MVERLIIIGSGPAGYTAAIYGVRDGLDPLLIRGFQAGGQLTITSDVENFPGFTSILGPDLMDKMYEQIKSLKCRTIDDDVTKVDFGHYPYRIFVEEKVYEAYSIIIATGANAKWLGLANEKRLVGKGVSGCATCDGPFFRNKDVVVVGGGDSAMEDATYLSKIAKSVTIIHRKGSFRASKAMQDKALSDKKIKVIWNTEVEDVLGADRISGLKIKNSVTGKEATFPTEGLFVAIGHEPNTGPFRGQIDVDESGYVVTHAVTRTSKEGIFAAGDVQDRHYKQAVVAAGFGCMAAIDAREFLAGKKLI